MKRPTLAIGILLSLAPSGGAAAQGPWSATIHRDAWGVPHVLSDTDGGAVYGMAWALAEDDWPLMEENYLHALGRYSELVGAEGLADDRMARALEIVPLSVAEYRGASRRMRELLDAYSAGLNAWLASRGPGRLRVLDRVEPWYPLALIRYKYYQNEFLGYAGLRGRWVDRLFEEGWPGDAGVPAVRPAAAPGVRTPPAHRYVDAAIGPLGVRPRGSNEWAVAPSRTRDGHALLLINPHQSFVGVQRYAEIHLDSREGLRFSGLTVFGFLLPYMGNNERLGWAYTDNYADHSDLWGEVVGHAGDPLRYRHGDGWRRAEAWNETIRVRSGERLDTLTFRFWKTHHGPVVGIDDDGRPLSVRMARMEEGGWFDQWDAMIRARDLDAWREAVAMLRVPYMNTMYADADGNIGYVYNSAIPRREPGIDPSGILEGSDPDTEWQGFHPLDDLPQVFNPDAGWLLNTNSTPFTATTGLPFDRSDFPAYMVGSESDNPRAVSSRRVLEAMEGIDFEGFATAVWDSRLSGADEIVSALRREVPSDPAVERLVAWDRVADTASVETTWVVLAAELRGTAGRGDAWARTWGGVLGRALDLLEAEWGTIDVPWGRINRHQRPVAGARAVLDPDRPSLAVGGAPGGLGSVFTFYSAPPASPAPRLGRGGNSFVKVVEFGPGVRAASILNYGQSGDPASPHFFDQAELYARRSFKPAWFSRTEVEENAARSYRVGRSGASGGGP